MIGMRTAPSGTATGYNWESLLIVLTRAGDMAAPASEYLFESRSNPGWWSLFSPPSGLLRGKVTRLSQKHSTRGLGQGNTDDDPGERRHSSCGSRKGQPGRIGFRPADQMVRHEKRKVIPPNGYLYAQRNRPRPVSLPLQRHEHPTRIHQMESDEDLDIDDIERLSSRTPMVIIQQYNGFRHGSRDVSLGKIEEEEEEENYFGRGFEQLSSSDGESHKSFYRFCGTRHKTYQEDLLRGSRLQQNSLSRQGPPLFNIKVSSHCSCGRWNGGRKLDSFDFRNLSEMHNSESKVVGTSRLCSEEPGNCSVTPDDSSDFTLLSSAINQFCALKKDNQDEFKAVMQKPEQCTCIEESAFLSPINNPYVRKGQKPKTIMSQLQEQKEREEEEENKYMHETGDPLYATVLPSCLRDNETVTKINPLIHTSSSHSIQAAFHDTFPWTSNIKEEDRESCKFLNSLNDFPESPPDLSASELNSTGDELSICSSDRKGTHLSENSNENEMTVLEMRINKSMPGGSKKDPSDRTVVIKPTCDDKSALGMYENENKNVIFSIEKANMDLTSAKQAHHFKGKIKESQEMLGKKSPSFAIRGSLVRQETVRHQCKVLSASPVHISPASSVTNLSLEDNSSMRNMLLPTNAYQSNSTGCISEPSMLGDSEDDDLPLPPPPPASMLLCNISALNYFEENPAAPPALPICSVASCGTQTMNNDLDNVVHLTVAEPSSPTLTKTEEFCHHTKADAAVDVRLAAVKCMLRRASSLPKMNESFSTPRHYCPDNLTKSITQKQKVVTEREKDF